MSEKSENRQESARPATGYWLYTIAGLWPVLVVALYLYLNAHYFEAMVNKFAGFLQYIL